MRSAEAAFIPREHVALAPFSTLGVGGAARWFARAESPGAVAAAHAWSADRGIPLFVLGGGSNVVIADEGFDGLVLQPAIGGVDFEERHGATLLTAGAGERWDDVVAAAVERELAGLECLSGIPGSVGGTPIQNVGAYGQEVGDTIAQVTAYDSATRQLVTLTAAECRFSYRMSRFKSDDAGRFVVCQVAFLLRPGAPRATYPDVVTYLESAGLPSPSLAQLREAVLTIRRRKGMVLDARDSDTRSVGSFFMNPVVPAADIERLAAAAGARPPVFTLGDTHVKVPAAWLIERAGFSKGHAGGAAGISSKHPLALVNRGGATARDMIRLATAIKRQVADRFGLWLRPEPVFVGFHADPDVEYLQTVHP